MCRLYGLRANEETKVECSLVHAQNALMVQSRQDRAGQSHGHGWGMATYRDHTLDVSRHAWAAYHGEHFKSAAARSFSKTVLAHVRRATVGPPKLENTHPFRYDHWAFAHNGTLPSFNKIRPLMLKAMSDKHRDAIGGVTDSEHVFHHLLSRVESASDAPLIEVAAVGIRQLIDWCEEIDPEAKIGLNILMTDGRQLVGTRCGRTLYFLEREDIRDCEICGFPHIHHDPRTDYRAAVVASEPISHEPWKEMPDFSIFQVTDNFGIEIKPLSLASP